MKTQNRMVTGKTEGKRWMEKKLEKDIIFSNSSYFKIQIFPTVYHIYES